MLDVFLDYLPIVGINSYYFVTHKNLTLQLNIIFKYFNVCYFFLFDIIL